MPLIIKFVAKKKQKCKSAYQPDEGKGILTDGYMTAQFGEGFRRHLRFFVGGFDAFEPRYTMSR